MKKIFILFAMLLLGLQVSAQTTVTGYVTDQVGNALPGVGITIKGQSQLGTITDLLGYYSIDVPKDGKYLIFSSLGMKTQEIEIANQTKIDITMEEELENIDEVVVTAYGESNKKSLVGAQVSVKSKELQSRPITNVTAALSGAAPGVQVTTSGGQPGSGSSVRIRGFGSINASSSPVYVVDGAIYDGAISDIPTQDIYSVEILKDAASTALYGSSAGNGVVLITTKSGKLASEGKPEFTFTMHQGVSKRGMQPYERVDAMEYYPLMWTQWFNYYKYDKKYEDEKSGILAMRRAFQDLRVNPYKGLKSVYEAYKEDGKTKYRMTQNPESSSTWPAIVTPDGKLNPEITGLLYPDDLDWDDALFRTGTRSEYSLSGSYRNEKLSSFMSLGHVSEEGYRIETSMKRYTGRLNASYKVNNHVKLGTNISFSTAELNSPKTADGNYYSNSFLFVNKIAPIYAIHRHNPDGSYMLDDNGEKMYDYEGERQYVNRYNPIYESYIDRKIKRRDALNTRSFVEISIIDGLKLKSNIAYDLYQSRKKVRENNIMGNSPQGTLYMSSYRSTTITFNQLLQYQKTFGNHNIEFLLGHESYKFDDQYLEAEKKKMGILGIDEMANLLDMDDIDSYTSKYRKEGYLTRLRYSFAGRYNFSASYRRDGTSRLHKDYRWGNFWAIGAAWQISEEYFMADVSWINQLKLRASIGQTGNDGLDSYYAYQTTYSLGEDNYNRPGLRLNSFALQSLKWETQTSYDLALEFALFNKIQGSIEFFNKESKDLIFKFPLPVSTGIGSIKKNLGKVRNYGIELDLRATILRTNDIQWSVNWNGTILKNEIVSLPEENRKDGIIKGTKKYMEGKSRYEYWLREWIGVEPETGRAMYRLDKELYPDEKGIAETGEKANYTYNSSYAKKHYCGSAVPKLYGGFGTNFSFKQFDLGVRFSYQIGGKTYDSGYQDLMGRSINSGRTMHVDMLNAWKKPGDQSDVPMLSFGKLGYYASSTSDRFLISSTALMLKSITLGYTLPNSIAQRIKMKNVRVSVSAENLFLLSKRKGLNPMMEYSGYADNDFYEYAKTLVGSISFTL